MTNTTNTPAMADLDSDALIDAAHEYASDYDGDTRDGIKTDVLNAFYSGAEYGRRATSAVEQSADMAATWQQRGDADNWQQPHNVYQLAEIAELRAIAASRRTDKGAEK